MSSLFASLGAADDVDDSLWGDGGLFSNNPVQDVLDREEGFTLDDLLDEDELIQEVKHLNTKLILFEIHLRTHLRTNSCQCCKKAYKVVNCIK